MRQRFTCTVRNRQISLGTQTRIMGIINVTPDSFSRDGCLAAGRCDFIDRALRLARRHLKDGADILDIGGESTRPGAVRVTTAEECRRIIPVIRRLARDPDTIISADTNKTAAAKSALDAGAHIINNIKGTQLNTSLLKMIARYQAGIILMHMNQATPRTMQRDIHYTDIMTNIADSLRESIEKCLDNGIKSDKIMIDPGIGFGKTVEHNLIILNRLKTLSRLRMPILLGTSRKSFIGYTLNRDVRQRLWGTAATVALGIQNGVHIIRVHDVKAMTDTARMADAICNEKADHD